MPTYPFYQVDAFTDHALGGNPCAIVFDADDLPSETMQALAREMNLSETAFVLRSRVADVRARYFTPAEEIPLAGHPTIATIFALVTTARLPLTPPCTTLSLELNVGPIAVEVRGTPEAVERITMTQKPPQFGATYDAADVLPVFCLPPEAALPGVPIQTVSTGTPQMMVPVRDRAALRQAELDAQAYRALRARADFFSPHLFCLEGATPEGTTFARHFGVPPDMVEDPFTGSATGGMAAYLWHYGLLQAPAFVAEQGHEMGRPGQAAVEVVGPPDAIEAVKVGGQAALIVQGELVL